MDPYPVEVCKELERRLASCQLHRMAHKERYDPGDGLQCEILPIVAREKCIRVSLLIEAFVGGRFAGQVYKVWVLDVPAPLTTLSVDQVYALKIFLPPSKLALFFRNLLTASVFRVPFKCRPTRMPRGQVHSGKSLSAIAGIVSAAGAMAAEFRV